MIFGCILIALVLIVLGLFTAVVVRAHSAYTTEPADCLILLGAKVKPGGELSGTLQHRCDTGLEAWNAGLAEHIIVCGGKGSDEPKTEAEIMAAFLIENGVPSDRIFLEDTSTTTIENLQNAKVIMEANGWDDAVVITSNYHLTRALWIAEENEIKAQGMPAPGSIYLRTRLSAYLRETVSWVVYWGRRLLK